MAPRGAVGPFRDLLPLRQASLGKESKFPQQKSEVEVQLAPHLAQTRRQNSLQPCSLHSWIGSSRSPTPTTFPGAHPLSLSDAGQVEFYCGFTSRTPFPCCRRRLSAPTRTSNPIPKRLLSHHSSRISGTRYLNAPFKDGGWAVAASLATSSATVG